MSQLWGLDESGSGGRKRKIDPSPNYSSLRTACPVPKWVVSISTGSVRISFKPINAEFTYAICRDVIALDFALNIVKQRMHADIGRLVVIPSGFRRRVTLKSNSETDHFRHKRSFVPFPSRNGFRSGTGLQKSLTESTGVYAK